MIELGRCHAVNAWEQRPFGKVYTRCTEKNNPIRFGVDKIITVASMQYAPRHGCTNNEYLLTYNVMKLGDIAFEGNRNKRFPFGRFVENMIGEGIVSHVFSVYRPIVKQSSLLFLKYYINNDYVIRNMLRKSTIAATMMRTLVDADLMRQTLTLPSGREQEKIGKLFVDIDNLIDAEKRKLDLLKQKKKALLHQIFEQKLRFKGYNNPWERRKGSDIIHVRKETNSKPLTDTVDIELENLIEGGGLQGDISLRTASTSVFREHDTLFGRLRPYLRKCWLADISGVKSGEIWALFSPTLKSEFLYALTQSAQFLNPALQTAGTKMPRAEWKAIAEACFTIPETDEQEKIGQLFRQLEHLTAVETRKIDLLSVKKKALLQKMFV